MQQITIKVEEVPKKELYLTQHYGDGSLGKTKFDARFILPSMTLLVEVDGKRYKVSQQDIISEVVTLHEAAKK